MAHKQIFTTRMNMRPVGQAIEVCFGDHERAHDCDFVMMDPQTVIDEIRFMLARYETEPRFNETLRMMRQGTEEKLNEYIDKTIAAERRVLDLEAYRQKTWEGLFEILEHASIDPRSPIFRIVTRLLPGRT